MTKNPLAKKLMGRTLILASGSPRRQQFFKDLGLQFEVRVKPINEVYPKGLEAGQIAGYLAELKSHPHKNSLLHNEILITSDTIVWHQGESLAKAENKSEALVMLRKLSNTWHEVITAVCFTTTTQQRTVQDKTRVKFTEISDDEIQYYLNNCKPYDKAGAYGIQEWIGAIAIERIEGSYNTVVGLPTHIVYKTLMHMAE